MGIVGIIDYTKTIERFDFEIQNIIDSFELDGETCCLKHNDIIKRKAVDYLCQNFKDKYGKIDELRIPICGECAEALCGIEWILLFCIYCGRSQWVYRPKAKLKYGKNVHVVWMDICPWCSEVTDDYDNVK